MTSALETCYETVRRDFGQNIEPIEVIRLLEAQRAYWRPIKTKVILLAESHVYTSDDDLKLSITEGHALPSGLPRDFVRLVYCLGYGEDCLLQDRRLRQPAKALGNRGTPQFWKIFKSCLDQVSGNEDFSPVQVSLTKKLPTRIANKLDLLKRLKAQGIWLVDASIAALYIPGKDKPSAKSIETALHASWDGYIGSILEDAKPKAVLCIGFGVAQRMHERIDKLGIPWGAVPQPNARLSSSEHLDIYKTYHAVCNDPQNIRKTLQTLQDKSRTIVRTGQLQASGAGTVRSLAFLPKIPHPS